MIDLPDVPRWVEAHGIAADPAHWRRPLGGGFAVGHDAAKLIVAAGELDSGELAALAREKPQHTILMPAHVPIDRPIDRAILHTLPDPEALPDLEGAVLVDDTTALPDYLADEITWARGRGNVFTVFVDGAPASFAYAPWRSARLFDISIDTIPGARQLGLATIVAAAMIRDERSRGREPVWGADEDNAGSLRLARRLGFEPVDEIWVASP